MVENDYTEKYQEWTPCEEYGHDCDEYGWCRFCGEHPFEELKTQDSKETVL